MRSLPAAFVALLLALATTAGAHGLNVFVTIEANALRGRAYFTGGAPARGAAARLFVNDEVADETPTDDEGRFRFVRAAVDAEASVAWVEVTTADGHRAVWTVAGAWDDAPESAEATPPATEPPGEAPTPTDDLAALEALVDAAVARHVDGLREELAVADARRGLQDILGGVGYLLGLTGLIALAWRRKRG